jgi:hypothetical protein
LSQSCLFHYTKIGAQWFEKWVSVVRLSAMDQDDLSRIIFCFASLNVSPKIVGEKFFQDWAKGCVVLI